MTTDNYTSTYNFTEFTGKTVPKRGGLTVSINRRGALALNRTTMKELGDPPAVILFYDKDKMVIGVGPTWNIVDHAIAIRREQKGRHNRIPISEFLDANKIRPSYTIRFLEAHIENGTLILDLNRTMRVVGGRTIAKQRRQAAEATAAETKRRVGRPVY